ncbi:hypothetical protein MKX01_040113 [Papaver californicum]|nr:hypothetical protein MKX01_040113 [Papaver californicum]
MYLAVTNAHSFPYGWSKRAKFSLSIVDQIDNNKTVKKGSTIHQFTEQQSDCGATMFMPLRQLHNPARGYLVDDTCINQGATCYMNSLLQTLYDIPYFRKPVYHMPTTENDLAPGNNIPLDLQTLFYKLQYGKYSVGTKGLTKSFRWNTHESFMQHDVQELNRVLCEKLEDKMKGTAMEGTIQRLFEGRHMNYIECINMDYKFTRNESFYVLQLDVKGCRDVYFSFDKYVEVERLEGDNKYHADQQHGLQDAKKGVLFTHLPHVLQIQLKRYEYDFQRDIMVKINDRYEFPLQFDLDREDGKYLSLDADKSVRNLYTLHAILVHSGGGHGGHYYVFIIPRLAEQWLKFNDEGVTKEDIKKALEEQYGGEARYSNAYMLVYILENNRDEIICNVDEKNIVEHLRIILNFVPTVRCVHIDKKLIFRDSHFGDGEIIFFQKVASADDGITQYRFPDVCSYLEDKPMEDGFCLELSKLSTYDDITKRVTRHLGLDDPTKIRLTLHDCCSEKPKSQPLRYRILDIPLPELQDLKTLEVAFLGDLLNDLKTKVELSHPVAELRLLEVFSNKIHKIYPLYEKIMQINDHYWMMTLRAEEIPEEEKNLGPQDCLIHVYQFTKDEYHVKTFWEPFLLVIHEGKTLDAVKLCIQKKLQVPDEEFAKWKFAIFPWASWLRPAAYLEDLDILSSHFQKGYFYGDQDQYLGLEHSYSSSIRRAYTASKNLQIG